jgi:hypothetical protein
MKLDSTIRYRRTTELEADAMVNEGGALRQPSMRASMEALSHLNFPSGRRESSWKSLLHDPTAMFWAGFATGVAVSLLEHRQGDDK